MSKRKPTGKGKQVIEDVKAPQPQVENANSAEERKGSCWQLEPEHEAVRLTKRILRYKELLRIQVEQVRSGIKHLAMAELELKQTQLQLTDAEARFEQAIRRA